MNKYLYYILFLPCIIFLVWYIPISYNNVYACDDFWHGVNVEKNGFFKAQLFYWNNWEGSYTHTFFATLPHAFNVDKTPFLANIFSLLFLLFSVTFFFLNFLKFNRNNSLLYSFYIVSFLYTFTLGNAEIRFWVCANITYLFGISTTILFISIYHNFNYHSKNKVLKSVLLIFLTFLIAGNKIPYIFILGLIVVLHDYTYCILSYKRTVVFILVISMLSLLNLLAPGNFERLALNMTESYNYSVCDVFIIRLLETLSYLKWCFLLLPLCILTRIHINNRTLLLCSIAFLLVFVGDTIIMYVCFHDPGPIRSYIIIEAACISYSFMLINFLVSRIRKPLIVLPCIISTLCITFFSNFEFKNTLKIKDSIIYSKAAKKRNKYISEIPNNSEITIDALPESGLLLSYFCNEEDWLKFVYVPYFNKDIYIHVKNTESVIEN